MEKTEITEKNPKDKEVATNAARLRTQFLILGLFASVLFLQYMQGRVETQKREKLAQAYIDLTKEKYAEATDVFLPLALGGNIESQVQLGLMYLNGKGFKKNKTAATKWFMLAANQDQPEALYQLAKITEAVSLSNPKVFGYLTKASDLKNIPATFRLAQIWRDGEYAQKPDVKKAYELFLKAALGGHDDAMLEVAHMNRDGLGVSQNPKAVLEWLEKAAQKGNVNALLDLAFLYHHGTGVPVDDNKALTLAKKFSDDGKESLEISPKDRARGYILLGDIHEKGINGVTDPSSALSFYEKAIEEGTAPDDIKLKMARAYALGDAVEQDLTKAWSFFQKIDEAPHFAEAVVTTEYQKIVATLKKISAQPPLTSTKEEVPTITTVQSYLKDKINITDDDVQSFYILGYAYENGIGVVTDIPESTRWYMKAADHDFVPAIKRLIAIHQAESTIVSSFDAKAQFTFILKAATLGIPAAQKQVAAFYRDGQGTEVKKWEALKWFLVAATPRSFVIRVPREAVEDFWDTQHNH